MRREILTIILVGVIIGLVMCKRMLRKKKVKIIEGLNTFNGRMAIDDQYFYDKLFDDVIYYPNEYDKDYKTAEEIGKLLNTGWIRCREQCPSNMHCVEFGLTANSYCI